MDKDVFAVVLGNEAIAFGIIEPFDFTLSQTTTLLFTASSGQLDCLCIIRHCGTAQPLKHDPRMN
jgi:hypothetical protein